jgi:hypothetical protein
VNYRHLLHNGLLDSLEDASNPSEGAFNIRYQAKEEFMNFVVKSYDALYKLESKAFGGKSSLCIFCRLDIGLIIDNNQVHYFINEIERTQTASLWSNAPKGLSMDHLHIGLLGSTFADTLHSWLVDINSSIIT